MLVGSIKGEKTQFLCLDKNHKFSTFCVEGNVLYKNDFEYLEVLKLFNLSRNNKLIDKSDGYEIVLDLDSGLYHFLKDDKDDLDMLYMMNGENITNFSKDRISNFEKLARKFRLKDREISFTNIDGFRFIIATMISLGFCVPFGNLFNILFTKQQEYIQQTEYLESFLDSEQIDSLTIEEIETSIYTNSNLDDIEKDFLFHNEFINDILPYFKSGYSISTMRERLKVLDLVDYTEEEVENKLCEKSGYITSGYTCGDGILHIYNYDSSELEKDNSDIKVTSIHEDAHFWQTRKGWHFITEAVAEILTHEYFLNTGQVMKRSKSQDSDGFAFYSYSQGCRYVKALMEMIGPEVVLEHFCDNESTSLEDAIRPYLNESQFDKFVELMQISPNDLSIVNYSLLRVLFNEIYKNKFGADMLDNEIINAILDGKEYSRIYFRKMAMIIDPDYYFYEEAKSVEEAEEERLIYFYQRLEYTSSDVSIETDIPYGKLVRQHGITVSLLNPMFRIIPDSLYDSFETTEGELDGKMIFKLEGTVTVATNPLEDDYKEYTLDIEQLVKEKEKYMPKFSIYVEYQISSESYFDSDNDKVGYVCKNDCRFDEKARIAYVYKRKGVEPIISSPLLNEKNEKIIS